MKYTSLRDHDALRQRHFTVDVCSGNFQIRGLYSILQIWNAKICYVYINFLEI